MLIEWETTIQESIHIISMKRLKTEDLTYNHFFPNTTQNQNLTIDLKVLIIVSLFRVAYII